MILTIAIAEDNSFALKSVQDKLSAFSDMRIDLVAFNGEELLKKLPWHPIDIILMDIMMPGMNGIQCTEEVKKRYPQIKVLMLTTFDDDDKIFEAIMAGASGYLLKEESGEYLHRAITETMDGGAAMSPGIAFKALNLIRNPQNIKMGVPEHYGLTSREIEILEQLKNGLNYELIGKALYISSGTVRKHLQNIYSKLQVNNKVEAIRKVSQNRFN